MKIRTGFVSNSSSSSFICDVCGANESGWDLGLEDAGMFQCKAGHTFCEDHMLKLDEYNEKFGDEDSPEYDEDYRYDVPPEFCPICSMLSVMDSDILDYILKKTGQTKEDVTKEIQKKFKNWKEFVDTLK